MPKTPKTVLNDQHPSKKAPIKFSFRGLRMETATGSRLLGEVVEMSLEDVS